MPSATIEVRRFKMNLDPLSTSRLVLRQISSADASQIFALFSNSEVMRHYGRDPMTEEAEAAEMISNFKEAFTSGEAYRWGLELKSSGKLIGTCGLFSFNNAFRSASLGYELALEHWGKGLMNEALNKFLAYTFSTIDINRVQATTNLENFRSIRSLEKLGFKQEGVMRQWGYWQNQYHDVRLFSLLKSEFIHP